MELSPNDDVESDSTLNGMLTWYKFNSVGVQFILKYIIYV